MDQIMNERHKTNITKSDLLNIRKIIENEMHQVSSETLFLTDIISIDENKTNKNYFSGSENLHTLIRNIIREIISKELKIWLEKNLSATISPILRDYLLNSRKNISSKKEEKNSKVQKKQIAKTIKLKVNKKNLSNKNKESKTKTIIKNSTKMTKTKAFEENYNKMTLKELQKEVLSKGIKLDRRNGKKTLISLLSKI
tara:strand:+ start:366 stop:959 length:594 start_codon:yes stop_codon:yes gene_type:complete